MQQLMSCMNGHGLQNDCRPLAHFTAMEEAFPKESSSPMGCAWKAGASMVAIGPVHGCRMGNPIRGAPVGIPVPVGMPVGMAICVAVAVGCSTVAAVQLGGGVLGGGQVDGRVCFEETHRLEPEACDLHRHDRPVLWTRHMGGPEAMPEHRVLANEGAIL